MTVPLMALTAAAGLFGGRAVWLALHPPMPVQFNPSQPWTTRLTEAAVRVMQARWQAETRRQAAVLRLPTAQVALFPIVTGVGAGLVADLLIHVPLVALAAALVGAWKGPAWIIGQLFRARAAALARDFAPLVLMLRIYLDLKHPLPEAFRQTRPALSRAGRAELDRLLAAMGGGQRQAALKTWAARTGYGPYRILADTLAQGWDQGLAGATLDPLDTLIQAQREQGARSLTDRLDVTSTVVPVLAMLGVVGVVMYGLFANALGG